LQIQKILYIFIMFSKKKKVNFKNSNKNIFMLTIASYVGLLFVALGFTLALYFGLTKIVKLI